MLISPAVCAVIVCSLFFPQQFRFSQFISYDFTLCRIFIVCLFKSVLIVSQSSDVIKLFTIFNFLLTISYSDVLHCSEVYCSMLFKYNYFNLIFIIMNYIRKKLKLYSIFTFDIKSL